MGGKTDGDVKKRSSETLQEPDFDPSHSHLSVCSSQKDDTQWHQHLPGRGIPLSSVPPLKRS